MRWDLNQDLETLRKEFPILAQCVYLISNSLGAVPKKASDYLKRFYSLWAEDGVSAWEKEWWDLSRKVGNQIGSLLGAKEDEVTMQVNATLCHWIILSTQFHSRRKKDEKRNKIVMTDHDFPSVIYAISKISEVMGWTVKLLNSHGEPGMDAEKIINAIDDSTLFVATSHVYFKSAYIQDIQRIAARARDAGALSLIDGYHAPGTISVDVKELGVDFYVGGCLKWLCGGPGNAFLYVRPEMAEKLQPHLTGWFAHREPFLFAQDMEFTQGSYRFMSGTPPVPSLYTAQAGLDIIKEVGISGIREKSLVLTDSIIKKAKEKGFHLYTPEEAHIRGGAVSFGLPHALTVKLALEERGIKVDFRKGEGKEPDIIRVGPHFYSKMEEVEILFQEIEAIYSSGEYKKFKGHIRHVT
jgi:kynureninase